MFFCKCGRPADFWLTHDEMVRSGACYPDPVRVAFCVEHATEVLHDVAREGMVIRLRASIHRRVDEPAVTRGEYAEKPRAKPIDADEVYHTLACQQQWQSGQCICMTVSSDRGATDA